MPHPFTPKGIAGFAGVRFSRLLIVATLVALVVGGVLIWLCAKAYSPVINSALEQSPDGSKIEAGRLNSSKSGVLSDGRFLSISVELQAHGSSGTGDLQIKLWEEFFEVCSLLGCFQIDYPSNSVVDLGYSTAGPWWGARQRSILLMVGAGFAVYLIVTWLLLALLYVWPIKLIAYFFDRDASFQSAWRLGIAAQLPAALLMALAMMLYGVQALDLVGFLVFFLLHFIVAWAYLLTAPFFLPRIGQEAGKNPFVHSKDGKGDALAKKG